MLVIEIHQLKQNLNRPSHPMALATQEQFDKDLKDLHLIYNYDVEVEDGKHESWKYEMWFFSRTRIVYAIHGG